MNFYHLRFLLDLQHRGVLYLNYSETTGKELESFGLVVIGEPSSVGSRIILSELGVKYLKKLENYLQHSLTDVS